MVGILGFFINGARWANAQVEPAAVHGEHLIAFGTNTSVFHVDYGKRTMTGTGLYIDGNATVHVGVEAQALWLEGHQEAGTHIATFLAGPRYSFNARGRFRPYARLLAGGGMFSFPYGYATGRYFVVAPGAGLDYRLNRRVRVRLIDIAYQRWPWFTFGPMTSYGVSAGFRYAFY